MLASEEFDKDETTILDTDQVAETPEAVVLSAQQQTQLTPVLSEEEEPQNTMLSSSVDPLSLEGEIQHDESISAIDHAAEAMTLGEDELAETTSVAVALESYRVLLASAGVTGLSDQSVKFLQVGFEHIDSVLGIGKLKTALESHSEGSVFFPTEVVSLEATMKDYYETAIRKIKKLFNWLMERLEVLYKKYDLGIHKLENAVEACSARLKDLEFVPNTTVKFSDVNDLSVNGKAVIDDTRLITGLTKFITEVYPKKLNDNYIQIVGAIRNIDVVRDDIKEKIEELKGSLVTPETDGSFSNDTVFPGNNSLRVSENGVAYSMVRDEDARQVKEYVYVVASKRDMEIRLKSIQACVDLLLESTVNNRKLMGTIKDSRKALDGLINSITKAEDVGDDKDTVISDINAMLLIIKDNAPSMTSVMGYIIRTLSMYLMVSKREIDLMSPSKEED